MSEAVSERTFMSTSRRSQCSGSIAETVSRPSGGKADRLPSKVKAWRKLQYVSGNSGYTRSTFIFSLLPGLSLNRRLDIKLHNGASSQPFSEVLLLTSKQIPT